LVVSYRGDRAPDPSKDSVLLVTGTGLSVVRALVGTGAASTPCPTWAGASTRWRLDLGAPARVVVARLFERGSYHLADAALRYRRGASGRQPLTPEVWTAATTWDLNPDRIGVALVPSTSGPPWNGFVAWRFPD
jgi:hypothetical protein